MKANLTLRNGHLVSSVLALTLFSFTVAGCGTDLSTSPGASLESQNDDIGTLPIPVRRDAIPAPGGLTGEILSGNTVLLRWKPVAGAYSALIKLDGRELRTLPAAEGQLTDSSVTDVGVHVYEVCFLREKRSGDAARVFLEFTSRPPGDQQRGDFGDRVSQGSN